MSESNVSVLSNALKPCKTLHLHHSKERVHSSRRMSTRTMNNKVTIRMRMISNQKKDEYDTQMRGAAAINIPDETLAARSTIIDIA